MEILTETCRALIINLAPEISNASNDLWYQIVQAAFRASAAQHFDLRLTCLIIEHKHRYVPTTFIKTLLNAIVTYQIERSNESIRLAITIFRHCNVDVLNNDGCGENVKINDDEDHQTLQQKEHQQQLKQNLRYQTLRWLHTTRVEDSFNLHDCGAIKLENVAELSALCVFSKIDTNLVAKLVEQEQKILQGQMAASKNDRYQQDIFDLRENLLYKSVSELIVIKESNGKQEILYEVLPASNLLKCVIDEQHFERQFEALNAASTNIELSDDPRNDIRRIKRVLDMYLQLLNAFMRYESLDADRLPKTYLAKKVSYHLEQLEMCVQKAIAQPAFGVPDSNNIEDANIVRDLFELLVQRGKHSALNVMIRTHRFSVTINWLGQLSRRWYCSNSKTFARYCLNDLNLEHQMRYQALSVLVYFSEGINADDAFDGAVEQVPFNYKSNTDMFIVMHLTRVSSSASY